MSVDATEGNKGPASPPPYLPADGHDSSQPRFPEVGLGFTEGIEEVRTGVKFFRLGGDITFKIVALKCGTHGTENIYAINAGLTLARLEGLEYALRQCGQYTPLSQNARISPESLALIQGARHRVRQVEEQRGNSANLSEVVDWLEESMKAYNLLPPASDGTWMWDSSKRQWYRWDQKGGDFSYSAGTGK